MAAPLKSMSRNAKVQTFFLRDKYLGRNWLPIAFWRSVHNYGLEAVKLNCPLLLIHPGEDDWTPFELSRKKLDEIEAPKKEWRELSNGGHLPLEQPAFSELSDHIRVFLASC